MCSLRIVFQLCCYRVSFNWRGVKPNLLNTQGQNKKNHFLNNLKMTILRLSSLELLAGIKLVLEGLQMP
jgi:hypothetical protein